MKHNKTSNISINQTQTYLKSTPKKSVNKEETNGQWEKKANFS